NEKGNQAVKGGARPYQRLWAALEDAQAKFTSTASDRQRQAARVLCRAVLDESAELESRQKRSDRDTLGIGGIVAVRLTRAWNEQVLANPLPKTRQKGVPRQGALWGDLAKPDEIDALREKSEKEIAEAVSAIEQNLAVLWTKVEPASSSGSKPRRMIPPGLS